MRTLLRNENTRTGARNTPATATQKGAQITLIHAGPCQKDNPARRRISKRNTKYAEVGMKTFRPVTFKTNSSDITEQNQRISHTKAPTLLLRKTEREPHLDRLSYSE